MKRYGMQIVFGPVLSRRFGVSLGVDLSPAKKQCNFDCVYCELRASKPVDTQTSVIPVQTILESIHEALQKDSHIDVLTFTANGEPTLYPFLEELIIKSKEILKGYPHIKTLILSNGSRFHECKNALKHFDIVKFSFDSGVMKNFKRVDKPSKTLDLEQIKHGIKEFCQEFQGIAVAEVLIVKNINDDIESNQETAKFLQELNIKRLDISTIDRPSSHNVLPVHNQTLYDLSHIYKNLNVCVVTRKNDTTILKQQDLNQSEILDILKRRPLSQMDCEILFTKSTLEHLKDMLHENMIQEKNIAGVTFYCM